MATTNSKDRLVVAVDFGTTYSGVAAVYGAVPEAPDEICVIKSWPGGNNTTSDKVPSEITYASARSDKASERGRTSTRSSSLWDFNAIGHSLDEATSSSAPPRWGLLIRPEEERLRCMKLLLDPRQQLPASITKGDLRGQVARCGKDAQTVVSDYLTELWKHAKSELERRYGKEFMRTTKMDIVLTVPAVWSDGAKDATLRAAQRAGMGNAITMISEPEAAAVYTLKSIQPNHLRPGNNFVVCDAGGGTVDLISYEIQQTSPLRITESVEGTGGCCGAAVLNMRFTDHVSSIMGATTFEDICRRKPRSWQTALKYFDDYVKRNFDPEQDADTEFLIPFPLNDGEASCVDEGFMPISSADVHAIFMPVIEDIVELVQGQVSRLQADGKTVNGIVLVGGFGQSNCLFKTLQSRFEHLRLPPPYSSTPSRRTAQSTQFEVMQPANAWTAVVRGAVLRGLEGADLVLSRKARRHYGTSFWAPFDEDIHPTSSKKWDRLQEKWMSEGLMQWYIHKGDVCKSDKPVTFDFYRTFDNDTSKNVSQALIVADGDHAPGRSSPTLTRTLCTLHADLSIVPKQFWRSHVNSAGIQYQSLHFTYCMIIESGGLRFDLRVGGVSYGEVKASFN